MALTVKPATDVAYDLVSLGECMIRLSPPGHQRIEMTPVFEAYAGGGEYNVARGLRRCFGLRTAYGAITAGSCEVVFGARRRVGDRPRKPGKP